MLLVNPGSATMVNKLHVAVINLRLDRPLRWHVCTTISSQANLTARKVTTGSRDNMRQTGAHLLVINWALMVMLKAMINWRLVETVRSRRRSSFFAATMPCRICQTIADGVDISSLGGRFWCSSMKMTGRQSAISAYR